MYAPKLVTAPTVEPVTLAEAQAHLRRGPGPDDAEITRLIKAARLQVEADTNRALLTQVWDFQLDCFPQDGHPIRLPKPPLITVDSITYLDTAGDSQVWASSQYIVDVVTEPGRVMQLATVFYPTTDDRLATVTVRFTAGYGAAATDIPEDLRQAVLVRLTDLMTQRGTETSPNAKHRRRAYTDLLADHKTRWYA